MFVTLPIARCATAVRSGMPPVMAARRAGRARRRRPGWLPAAATSSARPHPAGQDQAGDETRRDEERRDSGCVGACYRTSILRSGGGGSLGSVTVRTPLVRSADDARRRRSWSANSKVRGERAVAALDLMEVEDRPPRRTRRSRAATDRQPRVLERELDLLAREPGQLGGDDVAVVGFVDVDRRRPGVGVVGGQAFEPSCHARRSRKRIPRHTAMQSSDDR